MKIAVICNLPPPAGGAETFARELALALARLGLEVVIISHQTLNLRIRDAEAIESYELDLREQQVLIDAGIVIDNSLSELLELPGHGERVDALSSLVSRLQIGLLHCHMPTGFLKEVIACGEQLGVPTVSTLHGMTNLVPRYDSFTGPGWSRAIILDQLKRATHNVVVSRPMLNYCEERNLGNVSFIPGGLSTQYFCPDESVSRAGLLYVGKLNRYKGLQQALSAFLRVERKIEDSLYLAGRGMSQSYFEGTGFYLTKKQQQRAQELIDEGRILLCGELNREQLRAYYRASRALLLPSRTEGLPISILEALSCGTPVIASDVGSVGEVILDERNGYLIRPANIGDCADRILRLDGLESRQLPDICRDSVARYDINLLAQQYLSIFKSAMGGN